MDFNLWISNSDRRICLLRQLFNVIRHNGSISAKYSVKATGEDITPARAVVRCELYFDLLAGNTTQLVTLNGNSGPIAYIGTDTNEHYVLSVKTGSETFTYDTGTAVTEDS